ncbi:MAG: glycosyltransferase family 4 protein [Chloroflexi bacterium]|nr:glycosyltransferase family 4 protein [Ardenticatenaceae bacterium]MBL1130938.1 glycosyltransferase [Chloroflexota bacterium]NOG37034.1 glycosyltransferase family 4 protein [Chloroflexota bacterium]
MHILHLIHQYLPEKVGGTELYTQTLARHQVAQGDSVALFTPTALPITDHRFPIIDNGLRIYRIPVGERASTAVLRSSFHHPVLTRAFAQVLTQEKPDVVHVQHLMGLPFGLVRQIHRAGIPLVITLHDYWYVCANAQLLTNYDETVCPGPNYWLNCARCALARVGHGRAYPLMPVLAPLFAWRHGRTQSIFRRAAALIAPTHFTADIYRQLAALSGNIHVIPHGLDLPAAMPAKTAHDGLHIAYIGGIAPQKGVHILIEAFNQLTTNQPPLTAHRSLLTESLRLTIYGDLTAFPDYAAHLQQQANHPGITFAGRLPPAQLWAALADIDLIVVPTLWYETASLIVQEAFAAGVPVVASDIGVLPERIHAGVDGLLFPPGDAAALTGILRRLQEQPAELVQLRTGIRPVYTIQEHVARVTAVYEACVQVHVNT